MAVDRRRLVETLEEISPILREVSKNIHENPELRFEEHRAAGWLCDAMGDQGVNVERAIHGLSTAFRARAGATSGPRVAILAEYDALPEIGHACGHNLIAAGALGAFLILAKQSSALAGSVEIVGTPAEEGGGGKIRLLERGAFEGIECAMMFHPFDRDLLAHPTLASTWLTMKWKGTPSHAAVAPHEGKSALSACLATFQLIDSHRVHFRDGVRVHGYITNGGQAVNIIPEDAAAEFSVRAATGEELYRVKDIVERCARGAAVAFGVDVDVRAREGYRDMVNNLSMARRFGAHLSARGHAPLEHDPTVGTGSTDMGDVSHAIPSIHPWIAICDKNETTCHQHAFQRCAGSERGFQAMLDAALAMANTAADLIEDTQLLSAAKAEFAQR
jgi:amidohydrolase